MAYRLLRVMKKYLCFGYMLRNTGLRHENNSRLDGSGDEHDFDSESELCDHHLSSKTESSSNSATDNEMSSTAIDLHEEPDKCTRYVHEQAIASVSTSSSSQLVQQQQPTQKISTTINRRHLIKGCGQSIDTVMTNLNKINETDDDVVSTNCGESNIKITSRLSFSQPAVQVYVLENRKASERRSSLLADDCASEIVLVAVAPMMMKRRASVGCMNFKRKSF